MNATTTSQTKDAARNDERTARAFPSHSREAHQRAAVSSESEANYGTKSPAERDAETIIIEQALAILDMRMFQHGEALTSPRDSSSYLKLKLGKYEWEVVACLFLDNRRRVLAFEEMFRGTLDGASVRKLP